MDLKCYNPKCFHTWNYLGKANDDKDTLTCPKCLNKLRLGKARLGNLPNKELGNLPNGARDVERKRLDEEHKNLPELPGEVLPREELADEIGGVKIK